VLLYLLGRLHVLQGPQKEILGAACPTTPTQRTLVLPPLAAKTSAVAAAQLPNESQAASATTQQAPSPGLLKAFPWCGLPSGISRLSTPGLLVCVGTQTMPPGLPSADELLAQVLSSVRPWGKCAWSFQGGSPRKSAQRGAGALGRSKSLQTKGCRARAVAVRGSRSRERVTTSKCPTAKLQGSDHRGMVSHFRSSPASRGSMLSKAELSNETVTSPKGSRVSADV
jgi:hypothetical protein